MKNLTRRAQRVADDARATWIVKDDWEGQARVMGNEEYDLRASRKIRRYAAKVNLSRADRKVKA